MLRVKRPDGRVGAAFDAKTDTGEDIKVSADHSHIVPLDVRKNERNRIVEGTGPLDVLDRLRSAGALEDDEPGSVIATIVKPPIAHFGVGGDEKSEAAVLKTALHFVAGFVGDVPKREAKRLLPFILGDNPATEQFVRVALFNEHTSPDCWPPFHQVTSWSGADATYVSVMLFGSHPYLCRLPFRIAAKRRYATGSHCLERRLRSSRKPSISTLSTGVSSRRKMRQTRAMKRSCVA